MSDRTSACHWFPRLTDLPVPRTILVPFDYRRAVEVLDGVDDQGHLPIDEVRVGCEELGYPCFIRNDLTSAKHDGPSGYRVDGPADVVPVLWRNIEDAELKLWLGRPDPRAFMVREWLVLEAPFRAFRGHPIAREWRFFADGQHVFCEHFYWPVEAIRNPEAEDWREQLALLSEPPIDLAELRRDATHAALDAGGGTWSLDFAYGRRAHGPWRWWLIDMAEAEGSWHPEHDEEVGSKQT